MGNIRHPRRGSMQFWPRRRARHSLARIRTWKDSGKAKLLGFIGFKAGMTHVMALDNRGKSLTKGEQIAMAGTIIECPPITVAGVCFYKRSELGLQKVGCVLAEKLSKNLEKKIILPKKSVKSWDSVPAFDDLRLLVYSHPDAASTGVKKPKLVEIAVGGSANDKQAYAKSVLGKDVAVSELFEQGEIVDVHGITKGKGFQGTVKRFGVPIRQHKAEKTKRGIATLGSWTPKRVEFTVAQSGKMGYHLRTEYNKQILKIASSPSDVNPDGGITKYGLVKTTYVLLKGSIPGPRKRAVMLATAVRSNKKRPKDSFEVKYISK